MRMTACATRAGTETACGQPPAVDAPGSLSHLRICPNSKETVAPAVKELLAGAGDAIRDKTQAAVSPGSMRELLGKVSEPLPEPNDPTADQEAAENERRATTQALIDARRNGATNEPL